MNSESHYQDLHVHSKEERRLANSDTYLPRAVCQQSQATEINRRYARRHGRGGLCRSARGHNPFGVGS